MRFVAAFTLVGRRLFCVYVWPMLHYIERFGAEEACRSHTQRSLNRDQQGRSLFSEQLHRIVDTDAVRLSRRSLYPYCCSVCVKHYLMLRLNRLCPKGQYTSVYMEQYGRLIKWDDVLLVQSHVSAQVKIAGPGVRDSPSQAVYTLTCSTIFIVHCTSTIGQHTSEKRRCGMLPVIDWLI